MLINKRVFRLKHAAVAGSVLGVAAVLVPMIADAELRHDLVGSPLFGLIPSFMGGSIGACAAAAIFLAKTRRRIHPALGAVLGGILTSAATAFVMLLLFAVKNFNLSGNGASVSTGLGRGFEAAGWMLVYVRIVFPISIIFGAAVGWLLNHRSNTNRDCCFLFADSKQSQTERSGLNREIVGTRSVEAFECPSCNMISRKVKATGDCIYCGFQTGR